MATETWDKLFRQVALKANLLKASVAATLETNYVDTGIGATEMATAGVQFPKSAVDDSLLAAGDKIIRRISANPKSRYRKDFTDVSGLLLSGDPLPVIGSSGGNVIGVLGTIRDYNTDKELEPVTKQQIDYYLDMTLKQDLYFYHNDGTRIWHTRIDPEGVRADVITWNKQDQRVLMNTDPRGDCPFTEDLHEALVNGALGNLFRSVNNMDQANVWHERFAASLDEIFTEV